MVDSFIVDDHLMCIFCKQAAESVDAIKLFNKLGLLKNPCFYRFKIPIARIGAIYKG